MPSRLNNEVLKASINRHFGEIEDPRAERTRAHYLVDIIVITLFAVISGADSWERFAAGQCLGNVISSGASDNSIIC